MDNPPFAICYSPQGWNRRIVPGPTAINGIKKDDLYLNVATEKGKKQPFSVALFEQRSSLIVA